MEEFAKRRDHTVDEQLAQLGEFRVATKLQTSICAIAWAICAFQTFVALLSGLGTDPVRSKLLQCSKSSTERCEAALALPYSNATAGTCSLPESAWTWKSPGYSIVTEFDLICERGWLVHAAAEAFFLGTLAGCGLWHAVTDKLSPRRMLHMGSIISGVAGCLAATSPFLWTFLLFRVLAGVGVAAMGKAAFILAADVTGTSWRSFAGLFLHFGFSSGAATAALLAWLLPSWRWITLLAALLPLCFTITTWSFMVESPQWLLMHGRKGEATAALAAMAFTNRTKPPDAPLADPTALLSNPHRGVYDVFCSVRLRRRALLLCGGWVATTAAYYASALLIDALGSGSITEDGSALQLALTGFLYELPGVAAAALAAERLGRKPAAVGGLLQAGGCLLAAGVTDGDAQRGLAVAARFGLAAGSSALYLLSWETFPAVVQYPGMALTAYAARVGALAGPVLALAAGQLQSLLLPLVLCGSLCLAAAALVSMVPETLGAPTFETIQDMNVAATVKRHRSWAHSIRNVFRPMAGPPAGAIAYEPAEPADRSV